MSKLPIAYADHRALSRSGEVWRTVEGENTNWFITVPSKGYGGVVRADKSQAALWVLENADRPLRSAEVAKALWHEDGHEPSGVPFDVHRARVQRNLYELKKQGLVEGLRSQQGGGLRFAARKPSCPDAPPHAISDFEWLGLSKVLPPFALVRGRAPKTRRHIDAVLTVALREVPWLDDRAEASVRHQFANWVHLGIWDSVLRVADDLLGRETAKRLRELIEAERHQPFLNANEPRHPL